MHLLYRREYQLRRSASRVQYSVLRELYEDNYDVADLLMLMPSLNFAVVAHS